MSRYVHYLPFALVALLPWTAAAQMNAPLTGAGAAQSSAVASPVAPAAAQAMPARPVVRQMQTPMPVAAVPAASASAGEASTSAPTAERYEQTGEVTRALLAAQADGRRAGGALPILGPVSTASWNRYLESFEQPIPQWFAEKVKTDSQ